MKNATDSSDGCTDPVADTRSDSTREVREQLAGRRTRRKFLRSFAVAGVVPLTLCTGNPTGPADIEIESWHKEGVNLNREIVVIVAVINNGGGVGSDTIIVEATFPDGENDRETKSFGLEAGERKEFKIEVGQLLDKNQFEAEIDVWLRSNH